MAGPAFKPAARRTNKGEENLPLLFGFLEKYSALSRQHSVQKTIYHKGREGRKEKQEGTTL
jgi:hypothetical protein